MLKEERSLHCGYNYILLCLQHSGMLSITFAIHVAMTIFKEELRRSDFDRSSQLAIELVAISDCFNCRFWEFLVNQVCIPPSPFRYLSTVQ